MISRVSKACAVLVLACVLLPGCATITRGTKTDFTVETDPPGAAVKATNGLACPATPCTFHKVDREVDFRVEISKDGYETGTFDIIHKAQAGGTAGMLGNIIAGGLIGIIVDANSGATQDLVPNPLKVALKPVAPAPAAVAPATAEQQPAATPSS